MNTQPKLLAVFFYIVVFTSHAGADAEFNSYYNGKRYRFIITDDRQTQCPQWNPEKEVNPPLPAAKALTQAKAFMKGIPASGNTYWRFEYLALVEVSGGWAWRTRYNLASYGASTGIWPTMDCWILMDGTCVKPILTKR
jgi:hypothetical protein